MILDQEIREQPEVIKRLLFHEKETIHKIVNNLNNLDGGQTIGRLYNYLLIAARGTSDNAARYAQYLFGMHNHLQVALATPSLFTLYQQPPDLSGSLVIGISQSGQSPDIVSVINEGKKQKRPTLSITNVEGSPLANAAENKIHLYAGPEKAVAATKTYTASLAALALFSAALNEDENNEAAIQKVPDWMEETIRLMAERIARVERYRYMSHCVVIARGYNYATAFEIALKIKELTRTITEPYSSADFRHGPIALLSDSFPVIVVAPGGAVSEDIHDLVRDMKRRGAELIIISDQENLLAEANLPLPIPSGIPEFLTPLVTVIPGQMFAMALAVARGLNPDQPHGITKITETL